MHVSNHLISPEVSIVGGVVAALLIGVAVIKTHKEQPSSKRLTLAGILGAFVFAAQMFNFPIGALGCSGHLVGGVLLAAMLGPWLGFLTLSGVLTLQALVFADGGIMTLGWNIVNMAALGSLVAYPLIFRPIIKASAATAKASATLRKQRLFDTKNAKPARYGIQLRPQADNSRNAVAFGRERG
jgi:cobalt/nickel transport system permease protein